MSRSRGEFTSPRWPRSLLTPARFDDQTFSCRTVVPSSDIQRTSNDLRIIYPRIKVPSIAINTNTHRFAWEIHFLILTEDAEILDPSVNTWLNPTCALINNKPVAYTFVSSETGWVKRVDISIIGVG